MDSQKKQLMDINQNFQINKQVLAQRIKEYFDKYVNPGLIDYDYEIKVEEGSEPRSYNVKIYDKVPYIKMEVIIHD